MPLRYGKTSMERLSTVDPLLQQVFIDALDTGLIDISIIQGVRSKEEQNSYFDSGKSKVRWPNGKHNVIHQCDKARAVDAAPFVNGAISWEAEHCIFLAGVVLATAKLIGVRVRWGGNFDMDGEPITDQAFQDLVHFELV